MTLVNVDGCLQTMRDFECADWKKRTGSWEEKRKYKRRPPFLIFAGASPRQPKSFHLFRFEISSTINCAERLEEEMFLTAWESVERRYRQNRFSGRPNTDGSKDTEEFDEVITCFPTVHAPVKKFRRASSAMSMSAYSDGKNVVLDSTQDFPSRTSSSCTINLRTVSRPAMLRISNEPTHFFFKQQSVKLMKAEVGFEKRNSALNATQA